jgi:hypothetical protein
MWYDQTKGLPDPILATALYEVGPGYDRRGTPMDQRATVLWPSEAEPRSFARGYLFASPAALRTMQLAPLAIHAGGRERSYRATSLGYIGEPGGHAPPGYERTPLPNHLHAYRLTLLGGPDE